MGGNPPLKKTAVFSKETPKVFAYLHTIAFTIVIDASFSGFVFEKGYITDGGAPEPRSYGGFYEFLQREFYNRFDQTPSHGRHALKPDCDGTVT